MSTASRLLTPKITGTVLASRLRRRFHSFSRERPRQVIVKGRLHVEPKHLLGRPDPDHDGPRVWGIRVTNDEKQDFAKRACISSTCDSLGARRHPPSNPTIGSSPLLHATDRSTAPSSCNVHVHVQVPRNEARPFFASTVVANQSTWGRSIPMRDQPRHCGPRADQCARWRSALPPPSHAIRFFRAWAGCVSIEACCLPYSEGTVLPAISQLPG